MKFTALTEVLRILEAEQVRAFQAPGDVDQAARVATLEAALSESLGPQGMRDLHAIETALVDSIYTPDEP